MAEQHKQSLPPRIQNLVLYKDQTLGIGSFGKVVRAECDIDELPCVCAAKMIHETLIYNSASHQYSTEEERKLPVARFERECDFLRQVKHPNIVQFLGIKHDPDTDVPVLLMELMEINLTDFVKTSIPYSVQMNICRDIAQALTFLHSKNIVHRDLSSNNVLLDCNQNAKVADFGMARFDYINPLTMSTMCPGANHYMPPEAVQINPKYTEKIDCFSFGVIALQLLTQESPAPKDRTMEVEIDGETLYKTVSEIQRRQEHISKVPPNHELLPIIKDCLEDLDINRPSAKDLCERLEKLKSAGLSPVQQVMAPAKPIAELPSLTVRHRAPVRDPRPPPVQNPQSVPPGPVHQLHHSRCCSWKKWMITILLHVVSLIVAVLAYHYVYMGHSGINTPLNAPKAVANSWVNDQRLWGSYRSNVYFGMRPRIPRSLLSGMMWYVIGRTSTLRHTCEEDQVSKFGWIRHDGISCGEQEIVDYGTTLKTKFVTTPHGWTARVRADAQVPSSTVLVSFFFYVYNEGSGTIAFTSTEKSKGIIYGQTPELKKFQMRFDERTISKKAVYNHTSAAIPWSVHLMPDYVLKIAKQDFFIKRKKWPRVVQLPGDIHNPNKVPNVVLYQITTPLPFETDIIFEYGGAHSNDVGNFSQVFNERMEQFDQKFEKEFQLKSKEFNESEVNFAKGALSNLLGSISYFYGQSKVISKDSPDGPLHYWPAPLYTAIPSRTSFPRGFLWNEGFHQLLVVHWDTSIVKDVIAHWLDLMNVDGWIPREQILGVEARSKVPAEFIVQVNDLANPPTFFLTLETLIETERKLDFGFLRRIYPRLKKWLEWYHTTQVGEKKDTYRWRGRNESTELELIPVTMASGFNDFPRASHPTPEEYHVDLRCWMTLASGVMAKIAELLGDLEDNQFYLDRYKTLSDQNLLNKLHWDSTTKTYSDFGFHASDVELKKDDKTGTSRKRYVYSVPFLRFVNSFGYVNLFPFFFKLVSPTSEHLSFILDKLANKNILWTDYGLRSLSKRDPFYNQRNTKDDPPYWRGSIWINMNYLACRALHHYGNIEGPYRQKAQKLYHQLRSNLIKNMYRVYTKSGYIWEQYSDMTGRGKGPHPFTGWSSLIVLIMAEKY